MGGQLVVVLGAGPVGRAVAREFQNRGAAVRFVTRSGRAVEGFETRAADIRDPEAWVSAAEGATAVVHAAGAPYQSWASELPPMQEAVLAVAGRTGATAVFAENLYSYSAAVMPLSDRSSEEPPTKKGALRLQLSRRWAAAHAEGRVKAVSVRASDYFGPGSTRSATSHFGSRFFPGLEAGKTVAFLGDPDQPHSFTYLPDYARALADVALDPTAWGRSWVCPSVGPLSTRELAGRLAEASGVPVRVGRLPDLLLRGLGLVDPMIREVVEMLYQFNRPFTVDAGEFEAHFAWGSTSLAQAVKETVEAHRLTR